MNRLLLTFGLAVLAVSASLAQDVTINDFAWLEGKWSGKAGETSTMHESWYRASDELLIGYSTIVNGTDTVFRERLRIELIAGHWCFMAALNGGPPTLFALIASDGHWTFENPEHDFPQRVSYAQRNDGSLHAWIEGTQNGEPARSDFEMQRIE